MRLYALQLFEIKPNFENGFFDPLYSKVLHVKTITFYPRYMEHALKTIVDPHCV